MKLAPEQRLAVWRLSRRMGCNTAETHRRLVSVALYALGMDPAAQGDLDLLSAASATEACAEKVYAAVVDCWCETSPHAHDRLEVERDASRTTAEARS